MTAIRVAVLAGLLCSFAVTVWASGSIMLVERAGSFDRQIFTRGLEGLWITQALAIAVLLPWQSTKFGWRNAAMGQLLFLAVSLPLLALCWLADAAGLATLGSGVIVLLVESLLVLGAALVAGRLLLAPLPSTVGIATVQVLSVSVTLVVLDHWLGWTGL